MRWVWRAESGAGKVEYAALVVLVAVILGALISAGLPTDVKPAVASATCGLFGGDDCEPADPGSGDGDPGNGGPGGDPEEPEESGGSPDAPEQAGTDPAAVPSDLDEQIEKAEQDLAAAEKEERDAKGEYGNLDKELLDLLEDLIGLTDAKKCFLDGDVQACLWTALEAIPWGKAIKFARKIPKAYKLFDKWRKGSKVLDKAADKVADRRKKLDDLKDKKKKEQEKKEPTSCPRPKNSFVPGTPVLLGDGSTRPIEDVEVGDDVLAFDPRTGTEGPRPVTRLIEGTGTKSLVDITVVDDSGRSGRVTATAEHPFWVPESAEWVDAADLGTDTRLRTGTGAWTQVETVRPRTEGDQRVHNLTVADLHTFYVAAGRTPVLVHNSNSTPGKDDECEPEKPKDGLEDIGDPKKFDAESLRGRSSEDVADSIPEGWTSKPSKKGGGTVYVDPNNFGRQIRIMPGYKAGNRPDPLTHGPYVEVSQNGKTIKMPLEGNPTL
ncbi:intein/intein [Murinocardiopsis flavida]|uniref:Intein/intein n=1 Tax=Murinocardiopsis flavida TaxID=645275 RepID=A0A2P8D257_9ACTN|nr:polymorphic toxin-type HINT domain-containing protein [Murinocardiopsis flavida]PSK91304.1 intein/intein [Murinocardiopsis flavida]